MHYWSKSSCFPIDILFYVNASISDHIPRIKVQLSRQVMLYFLALKIVSGVKFALPSFGESKVREGKEFGKPPSIFSFLNTAKNKIFFSMHEIVQVYSLTILIICSQMISSGFASALPSKSEPSCPVSGASASPAFLSRFQHSSPSLSGTPWSPFRSVLREQRFFRLFPLNLTT